MKTRKLDPRILRFDDVEGRLEYTLNFPREEAMKIYRDGSGLLVVTVEEGLTDFRVFSTGVKYKDPFKHTRAPRTFKNFSGVKAFVHNYCATFAERYQPNYNPACERTKDWRQLMQLTEFEREEELENMREVLGIF